MNRVIKQAIGQMTWINPPLPEAGYSKVIPGNLFGLPLKNGMQQNHKSSFFIAILLAIFLLPVFLSGCGAAEQTDAEYVQKAKESLDAGQLNKAAIELKNALLQNPDNMEARLLLGTIHTRLGDGASAEKELLRAQELGVSSEGIVVPLAKSLIMQGKYSQVIAEINPHGNLPAYDKAQVFSLRGNAYIGDHKLAKAADAYRSAFELEPDLTLAQLGQARLAAIQGETEESRNWIEKALTSDPESAEAWSLLGKLELKAGNAAAAETALSKAIELRPFLGSNNIDIAKRAQARTQLEKYPEADADIRTLKEGGFKEHPAVNYVAGLNYFHQEKYPEAAAAFQASHDMNPSYLPAEYYLAVTHYLMGNQEQANDVANRVLNKAPRSLSTHRLLGAIQISRSDFDAATTVLQKALDRSPDSEVILNMLANASLLKGDTAQGVKYHEQIVSLDPESSLAKNRLLMARLMHGQSLDTGIKDDNLRQPLAAGDDYSRDFLHALEAFREGNLVLALERAQKLHEQYPDRVDPLNLISACYLASAMWTNARPELEKVLVLEPGNPSALINLAKLEIETDNLERARDLLRDLLEVRPRDERAALLLADVEIRLGNQQTAIQVLEQAVIRNPDATSQLLVLADQYLRAGEVSKVLDVTNDLSDEQLRQQPGLLGVRGKAQVRQGDQAAALSSFQHWAQLAPDSALAHFHYGNSLAKSGKKDRARKELERAVQLDPGYLPARVGEVKMLVHDGELEQAKKALEKLKSDFGNRPEVEGIEGWYALGTGDYVTAADSFSTILKTKPGRESTVLLSRALWGQGKQDEAIAVLQNWLKGHPRDIAVLLELADTYLAQDNNKAASTRYAEVLELSPNNVQALNNLAWLGRDKDLKQAIKYAEKAFELAPNDPLVLDTYGMLLIQDGNIAKGHKMIQRAAERSPDDLTIQLHLGRALIKQQKFAEAQTVLNALVTKAPDTEAAKEASMLLESTTQQ